MLEIVDLISSIFKRNKKSREVKILAVLEYMFHGGCSKKSKVLGAAFEPIAKPTVHGLAKKVCEIKLAEERKERLVMAVDEAKLEVGGPGGLRVGRRRRRHQGAIGPRCFISEAKPECVSFSRKALRMSKDKPMVLVDGGPWYPWVIHMLGLQYVCGGFVAGALLRGSSGALRREPPYSITD